MAQTPHPTLKQRGVGVGARTAQPSSAPRIEGQSLAARKRAARQPSWADQVPWKVIGVLILGICICMGIPLVITEYWNEGATTSSDLENINDPFVMEMLEKANHAIRRKYNYTEAAGYIHQAFVQQPQNIGIRQFYGSVLLSLDRVSDAYRHFRMIFASRHKISRDPVFLQQYILSLHRLGKHEELEQVWPRIQTLPEVKWRSPLQCPDRVDETLLEGATPFPDASQLQVTQLMQKHTEEIIVEFENFKTKHEDWNSTKYFRPNQDQDLVLGNDGSRWTEMLFYDKGVWDVKNCALFPKTCGSFKGLLDVEGLVHNKRSGQVSLLKLREGSMLIPHFGSVNWRYTAHLGLQVIGDVWIRGGDQIRRFEKGKVMLLDDSFLHSVEHNGTAPRVTFFVNFFHPATKPISYDEYLDRKR